MRRFMPNPADVVTVALWVAVAVPLDLLLPGGITPTMAYGLVCLAFGVAAGSSLTHLWHVATVEPADCGHAPDAEWLESLAEPVEAGDRS